MPTDEKLVSDIMVPLEEYPRIRDTLTLRDAIAEMAVQIRSRERLSLPRVALVFDDDLEELRGLLRRRDIMRGLEPRFLVTGSLDYRRKLFNVKADPHLSELPFEKMIAHMRKRAERLVRDYTTPIQATIGHDERISTAMCEMVDKDTSLLPVLKDGSVVGVLRSVDVLGEVALLLGC